MSSLLVKKHDHDSHLVLQTHKCIAELTLAPSRDEILPVRSQEPADQFLFDENKLAKIPSVPLGMESTTATLETDKSRIFTALKAKRP